MAKKKITISLDPERFAAIEELVARGQADSVSGWLDEAAARRIGEIERARRAVEWIAGRAKAEAAPGEWEEALAWAREMDRRRGDGSSTEHAA
ncbi:hypothetical protein [Streptomyces sp. 8N616]|uniref:hypothetical protein n=1 Tax=Streptomyces sp. 8N616 TaxID=3457414 RepID=UPI003FD4F5FC